MPNRNFRCMYGLAIALLTAGLSNASIAASAKYLDLAQEPLFAGTSAVPNVLVAVDDSGSMDFETLFPTDEGILYWDDESNKAVDSNGNFLNSGIPYSQIYPFDQIDFGRPTLPPISQLAYARSPDFNRSYFDPSVTYEPWLGYPDAPIDNAPYDPVEDNGSIDLTVYHFAKFDFRSQMFISAQHWSTWRKLFKSCLDGTNDITYCIGNYGPSLLAGILSANGFSASDLETQCLYNDDALRGCVSELGAGFDQQASKNAKLQVLYAPAVFYLRQASDRDSDAAALPADYGYKTNHTINGTGPDGEEELAGYVIRPENFDNGTAYQNALQNFANWFTYYRKRHQATRGGIVAAFDRIDNVRVGACTIYNRQDLITGKPKLTMIDLDDGDQRKTFYSAIFNIDYTSSRGTPNRKALYYLGNQLETNNSIITAACQRNYALLFTDGYTDPTRRPPEEFGNVDGGDATNEDFGAPFADGYSDTIADIAMKYYANLDTDRTGILRVPEECKNENPDLSLDCETDLHMSTFGITLNQTGTIFNTKDQPNPYANPDSVTWPDPNQGRRDKTQIDDLWHATINTRGELLNADTPAEIAERFTTALQRILAQEASASGVELDSSSLAADSMAYQASFVSGAWFGDLKAVRQLSDGSLGELGWNASEILTDNTAPNDRVILTTEKGNCGNSNNKRKPVAFRVDKFTSACPPQITEAVVGFIRGDRAMERANGGEFRNRNSNILGDIVHSTPVYVGEPNRFRYPVDWNDLLQDGNEKPAEETNPYYTSFAQGAASARTPMVYVGANDGMLHGFDAKTGKERLAFLPGTLLEEVGALTDPNYGHRYYVDGSPASGDVIIGGQWRTVLVGGLGAGGRAVYALDVTDPSAFSEDNADEIVLWEFRHPELGSTFGQPAIVRLHSGKWAAVFGNGYNSDSGSAQLFVVDIASGKLIEKIDTGAKPEQTTPCLLDITVGGISLGLGCGDNKSKGNNKNNDMDGFNGDDGIINGLSEVSPVDLDGDFITDYVYAGDLRGNVWRFDLVSSQSNKWKVGLEGEPLFRAEEKKDKPQPITTQPQVATHPYGISYGTMVYFGTGKYIEENDRQAKTKTLNTFYGIQDVDVFTFNKANGGEGTYETSVTNNIPRDRLQAQTINEVTAKNGDTYRLVSNEKFNYQTRDDGQDQDTKRGWYLDLNMPPGQGELVASNAQIQGDTVAFSTTIPNTQMCSASGSGYFMLLDRNTGGRTNFPAFDLNGDSQLNVNDTFARTENGESVAVGASGLLIDQGIPGQASHQLDPANDRAFFIVPASDGTTRQVYTNNKPDRRRSWREIRR